MRPCRLLLLLTWLQALSSAGIPSPSCRAGEARRPGLESLDSGICHACEEGRYSPIDGMPACLTCNKGSYADSTGSTKCKRCGPGEYSDQEGRSTCSPCPRGEFTSSWEIASCQKCEKGTFANMTGLSACFGCPTGASSNVTGATECTSCPLGKAKDISESASCTRCNKGTFANTTGLNNCFECPYGEYANITGATQCTRCSGGKVADGGWAACEACHPGSFANESVFHPCELCSPGSYSSAAGASECTPCPKGMSGPKYGMMACKVCEEGSYAALFAQTRCSVCEHGYHSSLRGAASCTKCERRYESWYLPVTSSSDHRKCIVHDRAIILFMSLLLSMWLFWCLMPIALRYRIKIQDVFVEQKDGEKPRVIVRTHGSHWISRPWTVLRSYSRQVCGVSWGGSHHRQAGRCGTESFTLDDAVRVTTKGHRLVPALFRDTGHPQLDTQPDKPSGWCMTMAIRAAMAAKYEASDAIETVSSSSRPRPALGIQDVVCKGHVVQALTETHLLLLKTDGTPEDRPMDTSKGILCIPFPLTLIKIAPLGVQLGVWMLVAVITALASLFWLSTESQVEPHVLLVAMLTSPVLAWAVHGLRWSRRLPTLLEHRLSHHSRHIHKVNPNPKPCPRGPERALRAGQLWDFFWAFEDCIRDRTMYYTATNILKPLTESKKLSYAELARPNLVMWFVSHYWGNPFRHFVASIRKHAETVAGSFPWASLAYWICSLSNNQWQVSDEVGSTWDQSSFYLALTCDMCRGTAMVLDDQALPLTRAWCLFELLQTKLLRNEREDFQGLWLCTTTGVLHKGRAGVDVAMRIAQRLSSLKLEDASASFQKDKDMIDNLVSKMPGGFSAMNKFIRSNIAEALMSMQEAFSSEFKELVQTLGHQDVCDFDRGTSDETNTLERPSSTASIQSVLSATQPGSLAP